MSKNGSGWLEDYDRGIIVVVLVLIYMRPYAAIASKAKR
jgi:hypothetical protein